MPYIKPELRPAFEAVVAAFRGVEVQNSIHRDSPTLTDGEMNYMITLLLHTWINHKGLSYATLNSAVGIIECVKQELYRTVAAPYEETKIAENGIVSNLDEKPTNSGGNK